MRKIVAMAVICLTAASGLTSAYAAQLADDEAGLRIRLKNELRRADKPSAGAGRDIYAWVQGGLLDFNSGYYSNIGNDSNLLIVFYVQIMPDDFVMQLHRF